MKPYTEDINIDDYFKWWWKYLIIYQKQTIIVPMNEEKQCALMQPAYQFNQISK